MMNRITLLDLAKKYPMEPLLEKEVQVRAYERYEQRGKAQGQALQDWLEAESEVLARFSDPLPSSSWISSAWNNVDDQGGKATRRPRICSRD